MVNFNPIDKDYNVSWQSDLENTKESIIPVSDKLYHKIKETMPLGKELENLWYYPLSTFQFCWDSIKTTQIKDKCKI